MVRFIKKSCIAVLLAFLPAVLLAQQPDSISIEKTRMIGFVPVKKNTTINGLAIGFYPGTRKKGKRLNINGVSVSASPLDLFVAIYGLFSSLYSFSKDTAITTRSTPLDTRNYYPLKDTAKALVKINGLMVGSFTTGTTITKGVNLCILINGADQMNGFAVSGMFNLNYSFKGVQIAGLHNKTTDGRGLQIGLFNSCKSGKLVQIGLINKIGKRVLPFINASL